MYYSDDPIKDFDFYDAVLTAELNKLPKCYECGEPIQDDNCYEINDELICPECLDNNHKKWTEDYTED